MHNHQQPPHGHLAPIALLLFFAPLAIGADPPETPILETGQSFETLASFDTMMRSFVRENNIPGAVLAVAKDDRLVYARGFGYADVEAKQPVTPTSLFRIASISKPITAVAVMQLVDAGKLKLDDRVFDLLPCNPPLRPGEKIDPRLHDVTIEHLLRHTGGWDRDVSFDPMFRSVAIAEAVHVAPPAKPEHIIRYMMARPLDFDPGTRYAYSNFGYCLLGRVIEHVSGCDYEQHVRAQLLHPLGIRSMRIGHTLPASRFPDEVCYYTANGRTGVSVIGERLGEQVPRPYGAWYLEAMDSHGGWIASAVDLLRFATAVADVRRSGLLTEPTAKAMFERPAGPPKPVHYGFGWLVRHLGPDDKINRWHTGGFDGSSTILVIRHDGLAWAVLFNTRETPSGKSPAGKIDSLVHQAANAVQAWPGHNLFEE